MKINKKDEKWQKELYRAVTTLAGKRYTPKLNIDLPISDAFDGLARNKRFYARVRKMFGELRSAKNHIHPRENEDKLGIELTNFNYSFDELLDQLSEIKEYTAEKIPWDSIEDSRKKLSNYTRKLQDKIRTLQNKDEDKERYSEKIFNSESHYLMKLDTTLYQFQQLINSSSAMLSNKPFLFLTGVTGIGKTHLLCDLFNKRIEDGDYTFMTLGQEIDPQNDIWKELVRLNSDRRVKSKSSLLKKFDSLGHKSNSRFLLIIDALNETEDPKFWRKNLPILLKGLKSYPNVGLIVSVRTGFEKEVVRKSTIKKFHPMQHNGFSFKEWDAIKIFFNEFGLPLPEVPLINPEFSVPLFLLLFCESRKRRIEQKPDRKIFRGHEGSTSIFEDYIKGVSEKISDEFKIGGVSKVWNKVVKPLAEEMVNNKGPKDRLSEDRFMEIIASELHNVDPQKLAISLERNHLLIKIPRYTKSGKRNGFDYRFTYQRFSDHLIARYLLNKYADKKIYGANAKRNFRVRLKKNGAIGKYFMEYEFRGVVNALSIQVPERLDGEELIDLCPKWAKQLLEESFLESLVWRDPKAFYVNKDNRPEKAIKIINSLVLPFDGGHSKFFSAILNVSGIPEHPFNGVRLGKYLSSLGIALRDNLWSQFLYYEYGEAGSLDRLLHWVLSGGFSTSITEESRFQTAVILTWCLTSSNRTIRDKVTKGLVMLLDNSPQVLFKLNKLFEDVDDPYVLERLYAVSYGVLIRLTDYRDPSLNNIGKLFYENIFASKDSTSHILIREYAKCSIEVLVNNKVYYPPDPSKIDLVQNKKWPRLPSTKTLEDKYKPKGFSWDKATYESRGVQSIWNSFNGLGDFQRYIVESATGSWSNVKKCDPMPPSLKDLEKEFNKSLSKSQRNTYKEVEYIGPRIGISLFLKIESRLSKEERKTLAEAKKVENQLRKRRSIFIKSLNQEQRKLYRKILRQKEYRYPRKENRFDGELAKRYILNRVFQIYSPRLHGYFDGSNVNQSSREPASLERIGKKYQWIAFYELLGVIADNYRFLKDRYQSKSGRFRGAWQIGVRDIDPTCIVMDKISHDNSPWVPEYSEWKRKTSYDKWLRRKADLIDVKKLLIHEWENEDWVLLNGFLQWEEGVPPEEEKYSYPSRDIFYILNAYFVKDKDLQKVFKWASNQNFYGKWMPESMQLHDIFLREFPFSISYKETYGEDDESNNGWISDLSWHKKKLPGEVMPTGAEYSIINASRDKSVEQSFSICLPSDWTIKLAKIKHSSTDGFWVTNKGVQVAGDISLLEGGRPALFFKKDFLLEFLKKNKLNLIWSLIGEKAVLERDKGRRQDLSGAYMLKPDGSIEGQIKFVSDKIK